MAEDIQIELIHDTLAAAIYNKASEEQQLCLKFERRIRESLELSATTKGFLQKEDLVKISTIKDELNLNKKEKDFLEASIQYHENLELRRIRTVRSIIITLVTLLIITFIALYFSKQNQNRANAFGNALSARLSLEQGNPIEAFDYIKKAYPYRSDEKINSNVKEILQELYESNLVCNLSHSALATITAMDIRDSLIVTGDNHGQVNVWDTRCENLKAFDFGDSVNFLSLKPNEQKVQILTIAVGRNIFFVNLNDDNIDTISCDHQIQDITISQDYSRLLINEQGRRISLYDISIAEPKQLDSFSLSDSVLSMEFHPYFPFFLVASRQEMKLGFSERGQNWIREELLDSMVFDEIHFVKSEDMHALLYINTGEEAKITNLLDSSTPFEYCNAIDAALGEMNIENAVFMEEDWSPIFLFEDSTLLVQFCADQQGYIISYEVYPIIVETSTLDGYLLIGLEDNRFQIRHLKSGILEKQIKARVKNAEFSNKGFYLITTDGFTNSVLLWDYNYYKSEEFEKVDNRNIVSIYNYYRAKLK